MHLFAILLKFILVLSYYKKIKEDGNRPGLHRSELKSCNFLKVEQTFYLYYCVQKNINSTSRSQTFINIRSLNKYYAVIPMVTWLYN